MADGAQPLPDVLPPDVNRGPLRLFRRCRINRRTYLLGLTAIKVAWSRPLKRLYARVTREAIHRPVRILRTGGSADCAEGCRGKDDLKPGPSIASKRGSPQFSAVTKAYQSAEGTSRRKETRAEEFPRALFEGDEGNDEEDAATSTTACRTCPNGPRSDKTEVRERSSSTSTSRQPPQLAQHDEQPRRFAHTTPKDPRTRREAERTRSPHWRDRLLTSGRPYRAEAPQRLAGHRRDVPH